MPDPSQPPPVRADLVALPGYEPVQPLAEFARRAGLDPADVLKLDANENPFGTLPAIRDALTQFDGYSAYPDPLQTDLRRAIADHLAVSPERIVLGAGSDELIDLTVRTLVGPGQRLLICPPTFGMYRFAADLHGVPIDTAERSDDFSIDLAALHRAASEQTALIILASPNNPTGNLLRDDELAALLATGATVLLDEAYTEFAGSSFLPWTERHARLLVLRTFSKWAGLAGLRAGYGVFPPSVAEALLRTKPPYNINRAAEAAVLAALAQRDALDAQARTIAAERDALSHHLAALGWLRPYPSQANFLLCEVRDGKGHALQEALARCGVAVRYFATPRLRGCVRISVPRPDQTATLLERLHLAGAALGF